MRIGVDIGGTKVLAGEVSDTGEVSQTVRRPTPGRQAAPQELDDAVSAAVEEVADGRPITAVGLSVAGLIDVSGRRVRFSTHLPWQEDDVQPRLSGRWGVPVVMDNDVACAAVAEREYGAGRTIDTFLLITVGTGLGGAVVHRGEVVRGANGMAGEFGHIQMAKDGLPCECGLRGCLEQYSSGNALVRLAGPSYADGPAVTEAAVAGDSTAIAAIAAIGDWLGVGLAGLVSSFDPSLVIIGGGVSAAGDLLLGPARTALKRSLIGAAHRDLPDLVIAGCGPAAGLIGAAHLTR